MGCCMDHESVSILKLQMRDTDGPCKRTIRIDVKTRFGFWNILLNLPFELPVKIKVKNRKSICTSNHMFGMAIWTSNHMLGRAICTSNHMFGRAICTSNPMFGRAVWNELPECILKITRVVYPKNCPNKTCDHWSITPNQQILCIETNIF